MMTAHEANAASLERGAQPVRIACVRYLNTLPLIEGLDVTQGVTLIPTVPSRIAGLVEQGEADVGLASIVDCVAGKEPMTLLPVGMIGCDGPTLTVRLYAEKPFSQVDTLYADTDSHTSVVLAQLILFRRFGVRVRVVAFDARERIALQHAGKNAAHAPDATGLPPALLLIGDKVITDADAAQHYKHQLDLGEAWRELTGLPFVYACWLCRTDSLTDPERRARVLRAMMLLDRARRHNATRTAWIAQERASAARWPQGLALEYLASLLRYEVTDRARAGAERFLKDAAELGLLPAKQPVWASSAP